MTNFPVFFNAVPTIVVQDPLAEFLGAGDGRLEYGYVDAVRLAGHSCPTVASAYWLTRLALRTLYGDDLPERGGIRVELAQERTEGVAGVIGSVVSLITGAAQDSGFKGIGGRFERRDRLYYGRDLPLELRFTRLSDGRAVDAAALPARVAPAPELSPLLQRCLRGTVDAADLQRFGQLWQDRVRRLLLEHGDDPEVFVVSPA